MASSAYLVLDKELNTLNGGGGGLRDGGRNTTHCRNAVSFDRLLDETDQLSR